MFVGKSFRRFLSFVLFLTVIACFDIQAAAAEEREENAQTGEYYIYSTDENGATLHEYGVMDGYETPETISIPAELNGTKLFTIIKSTIPNRFYCATVYGIRYDYFFIAPNIFNHGNIILFRLFELKITGYICITLCYLLP